MHSVSCVRGAVIVRRALLQGSVSVIPHNHCAPNLLADTFTLLPKLAQVSLSCHNHTSVGSLYSAGQPRYTFANSRKPIGEEYLKFSSMAPKKQAAKSGAKEGASIAEAEQEKTTPKEEKEQTKNDST